MTVRQKQCLLGYLGYYQGAMDGLWGPLSRQAALDFQNQAGIGEAELEQALVEAVSKGSQGVWDSVRYFSRGEFACHCGRCGGFPAEPDMALVRQADALRQALGTAIHVSSGVRCNSHNIAVGGVANSRHLTGKAMDFRAEGLSSARALEQVKKLPDIRYAYAIDGNYVHMDVE